MRRGFTVIMLKPRCNRRSGWGKGLLDQKKKHGWVGQKDQGDVGCVFRLERHCPSWICTTWSDGKQTVVPRSFSAFKGCCAQEEAYIVGKPDLDVAPRHCATLKRCRFQTTEDIQENAIRELRAITESAFQEAFQQWKKRWERCIASTGTTLKGTVLKMV